MWHSLRPPYSAVIAKPIALGAKSGCRVRSGWTPRRSSSGTVTPPPPAVETGSISASSSASWHWPRLTASRVFGNGVARYALWLKASVAKYLIREAVRAWAHEYRAVRAL